MVASNLFLKKVLLRKREGADVIFKCENLAKKMKHKFASNNS